MDRFSRQSTLSNFMTAVCTVAVTVTAAMAVANAQTISLPTSESVESQIESYGKAIKKYCTKGAPDYDETSCEMAKARSGVRDVKEEKCTKATEKLSTFEKSALESCSKAGFGGNFERCYQNVSACDTAEADLAELDEEDEGGRGEYCNRILANSCPAIPTFNTGRDYRQEKKDAERDRKDAKKDLDSLLDEQKDLKKDLVKKQRELQEAQQNEAKEARDAERKIGNQLEDALEGIGEDQKKAFDDAMKAYQQMDVDLIKLQQDSRNAANAITDAEEQLQTQCRAAAEKKYADAEKLRQVALAKKTGNKGSGANVSGSTKRQKALTARERAIDYQAYLNECLNGVSAEGRSGINNISKAKRAQDSAEKLIAAQKEMIEKNRASLMTKLKNMEQDANNKQTKIVQRLNQQLQSMNEQRQLTAQQNASRMQEFQQEQSSSMSAIQQKINSANEELMTTQKEAYLAASRTDCLGKNAQRSESARDRVSEGFANSLGDIKALGVQCTQAYHICGSAPEKGDVCDIVAKVLKGTDVKTGKAKRPKTFDVESGGRGTRH